MTSTTRVFAPSTIYHVYNRGNKKDVLFYDDQDFEYYLRSLVKYARETNFTLLCYCLMNNHFHFCCKQESEASLSNLMQKLNTGYAMYFNSKYKQVGHLFQGRYKAKIVGSDSYLAYLSMYIHTNPLGERYKFMYDYPYSSYREYYDCKENLCRHKEVLQLFDDSYLEYFVYGLKFKDDRAMRDKNRTEPFPEESYPNPKPRVSL